MARGSIRIDVWREGKKKTKNKKKRVRKTSVTQHYDLSNVDKHDKKCLRQLLRGLGSHQDIECQFKLNIDTSIPELYQLHIDLRDEIGLGPLAGIIHQCRSFCKQMEFDFPLRIIRITCLRLSAPLQRRVLRLKQ